MRVTQQSLGSELIFQINRNFSRMSLYRVQISSGKRINSFADDPRALGSLKRFDALDAQNSQHQRNTDAARTYLEATDSGLQDMSTLLSEFRALLVQEAGPLASDETRAAAVQDIRGMRDTALALLNQQVQGSYIFGGYQTGREPFSLVGDAVTYNGDDARQEVQVGPSLRLPVNIPGSEFLGTSSAVLGGSGNLRPRVTGATLLSDLNDGQGVSPGRIEIASGVAVPVTLDLTGATTVQDVLDAINGSTAGVTASIGPGEDGIRIVGTDPLSVKEVLGGSTASDLGILGSSTSTTLDGQNIQAALSTSTALTDVKALDGSLPLGILRFNVAGAVTDVDLSGAVSFDDIRSTVAAAIPDMDVQINDGTMVLRYGQPAPFTVESPAGDPTAAKLGVLGEASPARLFEVFSDVLSALEAGDVGAARQSMVELDEVHQTVLTQLVTIGARENTLDQNEGLLLEREESLRLERSRLEDVDLVDVATRLSFAEQAYQASLAASANVFRMSLLDYL
jgi:flagellin-like hook-associated protein FlgL